MARTKGFIADLSAKLGAAVFRLLSTCEDRNILPRAAKWVKLTVLGFFVTIVGALSLEAKEDVILCYKPMLMPVVGVSDVLITPNPTQGADSVTVTALARVSPTAPEGTVITDASARVARDSVRVPMIPADSLFGDTLETLSCRLYVGGLASESTYVDIYVASSGFPEEAHSFQLIVSEPSQTEER